MTGRSGESLAAEAARRRRELREEQERHEVTRTALRESQRFVLRLTLRSVLRDVRDFDVHVGLDRVIDGAGRLDWALVAQTVDGLLADRPHLGVPGVNARRLVVPAIQSAVTGTRLAEAGVPGHGAQGATRDRPGAGENTSPRETP